MCHPKARLPHLSTVHPTSSESGWPPSDPSFTFPAFSLPPKSCLATGCSAFLSNQSEWHVLTQCKRMYHSYLSGCGDKIHDKDNLRRAFLRKGTWWQEREAADHIAPNQEAERNIGAQFTFSFWFSPGPQSMRWCRPYLAYVQTH